MPLDTTLPDLGRVHYNLYIPTVIVFKPQKNDHPSKSRSMHGSPFSSNNEKVV